MGTVIHQTIPVQVWADIDEGIVDMVRYLNTLPGVRTITSCQGTIGEGGPAPYPPHVDVYWADEATLARLQTEFDVIIEGNTFGTVVPKGQAAIWPRTDESEADRQEAFTIQAAYDALNILLDAAYGMIPSSAIPENTDRVIAAAFHTEPRSDPQ